MILFETNFQINQTVTTLAESVRLKDLGKITKFLDINIDRKSDGIRINQQDKIESLYEEIGMVHCKGASIPIAYDNLLDRETENLCSKDDASSFRSAVGTLLHIANTTRPDIKYAVNRLCRHMRKPSQNALASLKHLVRYASRIK